jgi:hypothetical protein
VNGPAPLAEPEDALVVVLSDDRLLLNWSVIPAEELAMLLPLSVQADDAGMFEPLKDCRDGKSSCCLQLEIALSDAS